jgi:hypothetical protein
MQSFSHAEVEPEAARTRSQSGSRDDAALMFRAAAAGRTDVLGAVGLMRLQRELGNAATAELVAESRSPVLDVVSSGGAALEPEVRGDMEARLGADFSDVRIHTDDAAHRSAQAVSAHAYTVGSDIAFQRDAYDPGSAAGQKTLAHELTHVIQQRSGPVDGTPTGDGVSVSDPSDRFEREAASNAERVVGREPETVENAPVARSYSGVSPRDVVRVKPAAVSRDAITLNPVVLTSDPSSQAGLQAASDAMMARFPEVWRGFSRDWYEANISALASVPDPRTPFEASEFWKELGSNMFWATVDLVPVLADTVSVKGAAGLAKAEAHQAKGGPTDGGGGRTHIATVLANDRDSLESAGTKELFGDAAGEATADQKAASDSGLQDELLWKHFAPDVPFASRNSVMLQSANTKLSSWLQQFTSQFQEWRTRSDVVSKARDYELADSASQPFGSPITALGDLLGLGTPDDRFFAMAMDDIPFTFVLAG